MARSLFSRYEHHQKKRQKIKNDPELLEKYRGYSRESYKRCKMKIFEYQKNYRREMKEIAKELGNCTKCFKEKDNPKWSLCSKCREKAKLYRTKRFINS